MIILMKNIKGVQYDSRLPGEKSNTCYLADLSRLLWYREEISTLNKFTMDQFEERWCDISGVSINFYQNEEYTVAFKYFFFLFLIIFLT